jgi:hypothetical protein
VGTAFGGGAYVEAVLKFDPDNSADGKKKGWPSFWSMALEHLAGLQGEQWPGQSRDFKHFIEVDFFEYNLRGYGVPKNYYAATMHDWFGVQKSNCGSGFCKKSSSIADRKIAMPPATDFTKFHTYGFLWLPAIASKKGLAEFYFDGKKMSPSYSWNKLNDGSPSMQDSSNKFNVLDNNHLVLIFGTGEDQPLTIRSVDVWQKNNSGNLTN